MTRHQTIELITERLEYLDSEALEGLVKLLKHTSVTKKSSVKQRLEQKNDSSDTIDEESRAWLEADLTPTLPPYDWGEIDPFTLGEPLRYVKGKGWVNK
jgi:hypothetical protein